MDTSIPMEVATAAVTPPTPRYGVTRGLEDMSAVNARHLVLIDAMISWAIANPGKRWTDCAKQLNVSTLWCRKVASTDAFRARYAEVKDKVIEQIGLPTLRDKINYTLETVIERIAEKAETSESMGDLTDAAEVLLKGAYGGLAAGPAPATVQIQTNVILEARGEILSRNATQPAAIEAQPTPEQGDSNAGQ